METTGDIRVFFVVVPVFVLVGGWLFLHSRRRARLMADFARRHAFRLSPEKNETVEATLNRAFTLGPPLVRSFSRVRDVVDAGPVQLFRVTELIDRDPSRQAQNTHFGRVAALFEVPNHADLDLIVSRGEVINQHPERRPPETESFYPEVQRVLREVPPKTRVSIVLRNGFGLVYLHPLVVGGEKRADVEYVHRLASALAEAARK